MLACSTAYGQGLSERINHMMRQRARAEAQNEGKAKMLADLRSLCEGANEPKKDKRRKAQ